MPDLQVLRRMDERTDLFPFSSFDYAARQRRGDAPPDRDRRARIAFVGGLDERSITQERMAGYLRRTGRRRGWSRSPARADLARFGRSVAIAVAARPPRLRRRGLLQRPGGARDDGGLARDGVAVGRDIRVVGFDDIEECALAWPQLSSVSCDIAGSRRTRRAAAGWLDRANAAPGGTRAPVHLVHLAPPALGELP
jgi:LacI family transcriptional regulator